MKKRDFIISYTWRLEWRDLYRKITNKFYDFWKLFLFNFLLLTNLQAQIAEVCGSGIGTTAKVSGSCPAGYAEARDDTSKCFLLCPSTDQDTDGWTAANECDDTDRFIYPGISTTKGCGANEFRTCQVGGTYTACSSAAFTCATGSGSNYYVNAGTGNDANACTSASPCATLAKFSGGGISGAPAGNITLAAGDCVIITGTTNLTTQHAFTSRSTFFASDRSGTLTNPIRLTRDPRSTAELSFSSGEAIWIEYPAQHWRVDHIVANGNSSSLVGFRFNSARYTEINNNYIRNISGAGSNNDAAIFHTIDGTGVGTVNIHHNMTKDTKWDGTVNRNNVRDIMVLNKITGGTDALVKVDQNVIFESSYSATLSTTGLGRKHGNSLGVSGGSTMTRNNNIVINKEIGVETNGAYQEITQNRLIDVKFGFTILSQDNDTFSNVLFQNNTVRGEYLAKWNNRSGATADEISILDNIFIATNATYPAGSGVFDILPSASSADETTVKAENMWISNNNCYYNASTSPRYGWFQNGGHGGLYTLANWRTDSAQDATSYEENPLVNTFLLATSTNCTGKGWTYTPTGGGGGGGGSSSSSTGGTVSIGSQPWLSY